MHFVSVDFRVLLRRLSILFAGVVSNFVYYPRKKNRKSAKIIPKTRRNQKALTVSKHFTATVYVLEQDKVLLHFHAKHQKWLPPGGHLEANETPAECALREVLEETGLHVELIRDERIWIDALHAKSCERPLMCLIESIPAHKDVPAHEHIDFIYMARPLTKEIVCEGQIRWFILDEVLQLIPGKDIFEDCIETIRYLLGDSS